MESDFTRLERRVTEVSVIALMTDCDSARAAHLALLNLYYERLDQVRKRAVEAYRQIQIARAAQGKVMPPHFMHYRDALDRVTDQDGAEYPDVVAARAMAVAAAR